MTSVSAADSSTNQTVKTDGIVITVNVNTASAEEISTLLKGVGLKKAQAIVEYRGQHGPFASKDDLTKVKGIGASTVKKNEDRILL
ncbi:helix-hairpin-helix domain-containing protein [Vibrio plantisponsor]|uniref:Helix-hairpin-helix domain-containing protein n=1 Tax=Vibrio plantisponsor TaxID=664643 RepID=A0ABU4IFE5_9VIBR|nr:helix-hairpin-helix domain-containing protein [Vibrio plantisponsor]MDW6016562.1 helix-hairpin-helix domain-containing protein [Vibrio plantisponsor]